MGTQFFGSLLGIGIAVGSLALMAGYYGYRRWYKKETIEITGEVITLISIFVVLGAVSGYKLAESSFHYAKQGTKAVLHVGQEAISETVKYFAVAVLEGVGKTQDHFKGKWDKEKVENFKNLDIKVINVEKKIKYGKTALHLELHITNSGQEMINFKDLVTHQLLLLKGKKESYYPVTFNGLSDQNMIIPPTTTIEQEIDILVHDENYPTMLSTPYQELELKSS